MREVARVVPAALAGVEHLIIAEDEAAGPVGFMGTDGGRLEMLFLLPRERGRAGQAAVCCGMPFGAMPAKFASMSRTPLRGRFMSIWAFECTSVRSAMNRKGCLRCFTCVWKGNLLSCEKFV